MAGRSRSGDRKSAKYRSADTKRKPASRSKSSAQLSSDFPKVVPLSSPNATDEERCRFLEDLGEFLQKSVDEFLERSGPHPEIGAAEKKLGPRLITSVQLCIETWKKLKRDFPNIVSKMLGQCLHQLVPKVEHVKKNRKATEKTIDELHAATMVGCLNALATPTCDPQLAKICIQSNFEGLSRYLLAVPHRCKIPDQCTCYQVGPIEDTIELVTLVSAAKFAPEVLVDNLEKLANHYNDTLSFNYVNSLGLLYHKNYKTEVEGQMPKIVNDLKMLLNSKKDMSQSTLIIRRGPGQYLAQGQPIDYVLVSLDIILKKISHNNPEAFDKDSIDLVERFYIEQRPMSCLICLEVLKNLYKAGKIDKKRSKKYFQIAKELDLPEKEIVAMKNVFH